MQNAKHNTAIKLYLIDSEPSLDALPLESHTNNVDDGLAIPTIEDEVLSPEIPLSSPTITPPKTVAETTGGDTGDNGGKCYAITGASGGVGVTGFAIQLAYDLAMTYKNSPTHDRYSEPKVCLIDLDFEGGSCAHYLDLPPSLQISDLQDSPNRIDRSLTTALMSTHDSGIALLAAPNVIGGNDKVNPATVLALLDVACEIYDHVILDVPRFWRPWTHAAIGASDHVIMLTEMTIPALHLCRNRAEMIEVATELERPIDIIINKFERRSLKNSIRLPDAQLVLKRDVFGTICIDNETTIEAVNCGEPASVVKPEARYVKDLRRLARQITNPQEDGQNQVAPARILGFKNRRKTPSKRRRKKQG